MGEDVWVIDYNNLEPVLENCVFHSLGSNWVTRISPKMKHLGRALIDAEAKIVFGHSAHPIPLEPIEIYKGGLIIYGVGDFVNDYAVASEIRSDKALMCTISGRGRVSLVPVRRTFVNSRSSISIPF